MANNQQNNDSALQKLADKFACQKAALAARQAYEELKQTVNSSVGYTLSIKRAFDVASVGVYGLLGAGLLAPGGAIGEAAYLGVKAAPYLMLGAVVTSAVSLAANSREIVSALRGDPHHSSAPAEKAESATLSDLRTKFSTAARKFALQETVSGISMALASTAMFSFLKDAFAGGTGEAFYPTVAFTVAGVVFGWRAHRDADHMNVYAKGIENEIRKPSAPGA